VLGRIPARGPQHNHRYPDLGNLIVYVGAGVAEIDGRFHDGRAGQLEAAVFLRQHPVAAVVHQRRVFPGRERSPTLEPLVHLLPVLPVVAPPRHRVILHGIESTVAVFRVGIRFEDDRIHQQQPFERAGAGGGHLNQTVPPHGVTDPDGIDQPQMLHQLTDVLAERPPHVRRNPLAATVAPHVDRVHTVAGTQLGDHPVPATGVKPGGVQQQHRLLIRLAPLEVGQPRAGGLQVMSNRFEAWVGVVHRDGSGVWQSRAW
jgi:hypothetical protein